MWTMWRRMHGASRASRLVVPRVGWGHGGRWPGVPQFAYCRCSFSPPTVDLPFMVSGSKSQPCKRGHANQHDGPVPGPGQRQLARTGTRRGQRGSTSGSGCGRSLRGRDRVTSARAAQGRRARRSDQLPHAEITGATTRHALPAEGSGRWWPRRGGAAQDRSEGWRGLCRR